MEILITGLEVWAHHGVLPHETALGQPFVVDVALVADVAPTNDELDETIDYGALASRIHDVVAAPPRQLIETVVADVCDEVLRDPRVREVTVTLHKPRAPIAVIAADVAVRLTRARS